MKFHSGVSNPELPWWTWRVELKSGLEFGIGHYCGTQKPCIWLWNPKTQKFGL